MSLLLLRDSLARSKTKWKRWMNTGSKRAATVAATAGQSVWPGITSLLSQLESTTDMFSPLKSAIEGLSRLVETYERVSGKQSEFIELRERISKILEDISAHIESPADSIMTKSVRLICLDIETEVNITERKQGYQTGRRFLDAMVEQDEVIDCCRRVHAHLERLTLNLNLGIMKGVNEQVLENRLARISPSMSASYNSAESDTIKRRSCTPGTRQPQIDMLLQWARTPDSGKTCWMNGMAGTGKTTIAYTICSLLERNCQLGASFFCSRTIPECRLVKYIIPTIAYQLARFSLPFRCALGKALEQDPDAHTRALSAQYQKLIAEPLTEVQQSLPADLIVVIDALDECEGEDNVSQIMDQLLSTTDTIPIRFLISSRPEKQIAQRMAGRLSEHDDTRLVLHDLDRSTVRTDIEAYMRAELKDVPLSDTQWPLIVDCCGELFIYASTVCRYVKNAHENRSLNEAVVVVTSSGSGPETENMIDDLYSTVLDAANNSTEMNNTDKERMNEVLQTVVCAMEPMCVDVIASLLRLDSGDRVYRLLAPLRSVLNVTKGTGMVTTLHASFADFMLSTGRSAKFHCQPSIRHKKMAEACLQVIEASKRKFNVCALPSSYLLDHEVEGLEEKKSQSISAELVYACRHWSGHLSLSQGSPGLINCVHHFYSARLLLWMEIINLTKKMRYATLTMQGAEKWCIQKKAPEGLIRLAGDASQFVSTYANHPVSQSTPHIYTSMLPFWPQSRPISTLYMPRTSGLVRPTGTAIDRRQLALIATWEVSNYEVGLMSLTADGTRLAAPGRGSIEVYDTATGGSVLSLTNVHTFHVHWAAISPESTSVVFSRRGGIPYIWDIRNGDTVLKLLPDGVSGVRSIAFSSDGTRVACGLENGEAYIQALHGATNSIGPLKVHDDWVRSVAFSPNGLHLASGSWESTIRVWDLRTGQPVGEPFRGHVNTVWSLSYSCDGSRLASASSDKTIRVWDPQTGKTVLGPLKGHSSIILCVAFSSSGAHVASGSGDRTIRVYDAHTGHTVLGPLHGHNYPVNSVIFSPDCTRLFSCSDDGTVRIWNVQYLGVSAASSMAQVGISSIRYSHSGARVVSGSYDGSIHVWDVRTSEMMLGPLRDHEGAIQCLDYSPDDQYIASGLHNNTLQIWDTSIGKVAHRPMQRHSDLVVCVRFSADGSSVVSCSYDGTVRLWDVNTGEQTKQLFNEESAITSVCISPEGHWVAFGSQGGKIRVLDVHTGNTQVGPIDAHTYCVNSVEFSPNGKRLASGSSDESVRIWDTLTGKQLAACGEHGGSHSGPIKCVAFSPSGLYIASCSIDRTVRIWDGQNGKLVLGPLTGHTATISGVHFSPDGSHIVSCSHDATIRFWDMSSVTNSLLGYRTTSTGEEVAHSSNNDIASVLWSLDDEGWVIDSYHRRLVWVPPDLRTSLALPPTSSIIADQGYYRLETDGCMIGDNWMECYEP